MHLIDSIFHLLSFGCLEKWPTLITFTWAGWTWELDNFSSNVNCFYYLSCLSGKKKKSYQHVIKSCSLSISNCFSVKFHIGDEEVWIISQDKIINQSRKVYFGFLLFYILILQNVQLWNTLSKAFILLI